MPHLPHDSRRAFLKTCGIGASVAVTAFAGCIGNNAAALSPAAVWGRKGLSDGRLMKPRAVQCSPKDELYIVDMTGRIQIFDTAGEYLRGWRTPEIKQGKPTGLAFSNDGNLIVADTHYFRVLFYSPDGELDETRTIGGTHGDKPGEFHFVTDVAEDSRGHFFVGQYGQIDHIQEFAPDGTYIQTFGNQGSKPGEFSRPQSLVIDGEGLLWIADACNHRIQIYDVSGGHPELVNIWGSAGDAAGQLRFPYGLDFDEDGTVLVCEYGNHRVQRFDRDGKSLQLWGGAGKEAGKFDNPWALAFASDRRLFVLDSENHRVQKFLFS